MKNQQATKKNIELQWQVLEKQLLRESCAPGSVASSPAVPWPLRSQAASCHESEQLQPVIIFQLSFQLLSDLSDLSSLSWRSV